MFNQIGDLKGHLAMLMNAIARAIKIRHPNVSVTL